MTTCNDIVRLAMGRLRQLRGGEIPTGTEAEDGMIFLQALYDGWATSGLFGRLNDTIPSANYTAQEQDRVINDGAYMITLPLTITNSLPMGGYYPVWPDERSWSYLQCSAARPPRDLACIEVIASNACQRSIYDARSRVWVRLDSLALTTAAPLADRGALGLASCLAEMMSDDYGAQVAPDIAKRSALFRWGLSAHYDSTRVDGMQDYF